MLGKKKKGVRVRGASLIHLFDERLNICWACETLCMDESNRRTENACLAKPLFAFCFKNLFGLGGTVL